MKKLLLSGLFFIATPVILVTSMFFLLVLMHQDTSGTKPRLISMQRPVAYAALPGDGLQFNQEITPSIAKEETLKQFLLKYDSPLAEYTDFLIETADTYKLDHRLLPAIAMQETNLCKKAKEDSHNCWGYNVTGGNYKFFDNYEQAIDTVGKTLAKYRDSHNLVTPEEIEKRYTPSSNGSWAESVNFFMERL